jgi:hypothetical protein
MESAEADREVKAESASTPWAYSVQSGFLPVPSARALALLPRSPTRGSLSVRITYWAHGGFLMTPMSHFDGEPQE